MVVLGGTGFVGSAILEKCQAAGLATTALVRKPAQAAILPEGVTAVVGEVNALPMGLLPSRPHVVAHFGTKQVNRDHTGFERVNVEGTRQLLAMANRHTKGIIYGSSMGVYGGGAQHQAREAVAPRPETLLSKSLAAAEALVMEKARAMDIWGIPLRPRFILGPGDRYVLPALRKLGALRIGLIGGNPRYSVIHVDDYADIVVRLALHMAQPGQPAQQRPLNIGYRRPLGLREIWHACGLQPPRWGLPLNGRLPQWLARSGSHRLRRLADKIKLIGLSHHGCVDEAARLLGPEPFEKNPIYVLQDLNEQQKYDTQR